MKELKAKHDRVKGLEQRLQQRRARLMGKLPDIKKALEMVDVRVRPLCAATARKFARLPG